MYVKLKLKSNIYVNVFTKVNAFISGFFSAWLDKRHFISSKQLSVLAGICNDECFHDYLMSDQRNIILYVVRDWRCVYDMSQDHGMGQRCDHDVQHVICITFTYRLVRKFSRLLIHLLVHELYKASIVSKPIPCGGCCQPLFVLPQILFCSYHNINIKHSLILS